MDIKNLEIFIIEIKIYNKFCLDLQVLSKIN